MRIFVFRRSFGRGVSSFIGRFKPVLPAKLKGHAVEEEVCVVVVHPLGGSAGVIGKFVCESLTD